MVVLVCAGSWVPVAQSTAAESEPGSGTAALTAVEDSAKPLFALPSTTLECQYSVIAAAPLLLPSDRKIRLCPVTELWFRAMSQNMR
jgi:hypothetical protein